MFPERRCLAVDARGHGRSSEPATALPLAHLRPRHGGRRRTLRPARCHRHRPFQRRPHHRAGGRAAPADLSRAAADGPHDLPAGVLRHGAAGRVVHPAPPQCLDIARRDVRALQRPPAVRPLAARRSCAITAITACCRSDGQFVLACPPAVEASIYENSKSRRHPTSMPKIAHSAAAGGR